MPAGQRVSSPGLTDQQHRAVTARGASVALSAGAGCGKTFVLIERFLAELDPDGTAARPRLNQLAAITFTERAAREMRDRVRAACHRRLLNCPPEHADYWLELLRDLDSARISTIHAFCGSLLRGHAVEAGVDPRFRVLDGAAADTLLFELIDNVLRERLALRDESTLALVTRFGLDRLRQMIARLLATRQSIDWSAWRGETAETLSARWYDFWRTDTVPRVLRKISESAPAITVLDLATRYPPSHAVMRQRCDFLREHLPALSASQQVAADLAAIREAARVQGGGTNKHWVNEEIYAQFRDAAKALRDAIDGVAAQIEFDRAAAMPAAEAALQALCLAADMATEYDRRKQELAVLDFNDLLIRARDLLVDPDHPQLRKRLAAGIHLLLVDEFQDTDPLQVEVVKALCDNEYLRGKLFLVGDYKQSIYRFRGAQPHVFRQLRGEVPAAGQLPLTLNFRSQPAVLEFVNQLFREEFGADYEPLEAHRPQLGPSPAVEFLWAIDDPSAGPTGDEPPVPNSALDDMGRQERLRRREADWIARRIRAMLDGGEKIVCDDTTGHSELRALRPGDVALLFRALTNVEYYEEALRRYGIDYYLVGGHAFYAQQEIYDLLNLLRAINSPCDEVSLAGVLRSPFFGLLDESLLWLSQPRSLAAGLFDAEPPEHLDAQQRQQAQYAAATLCELRALKDRLPIAELIYQALDRTGYDALLLAEFLGERKLANLHKLIEQARSFDRTGMFFLSDFITQLSQFVARQPDEALAATHPESTDVVKLMSIHQSKGLEFPVVVVPDIARPRMVRGSVMAFTPELGPMFKDADATTGYDLFMMAENEEDLSELTRLFYVATTRAADFLILSAATDDPGASAGPWMEMLGRRFDLTTGASRSTRGEPRRPSAAQSGRRTSQTFHNCVMVTATRPAIQSKPVDLRHRRDLMKIVDKATQMAHDGAGRRPRYLAPVAYDGAARRQYSFSRLRGTLHASTSDVDLSPMDDEAPSRSPLDARGLGTLVHAVLSQVDFARPEDVRDLVRRHADEHFSGVDASPEEPVELIRRFLASPRAAEIAAAKRVYRELEFLLAWPPEDHAAHANAANPSGLHLQGFIDCLYCDTSGQWNLLDYKTNHVTQDTLADVAAQYELQMLVYALAAERILKSPPSDLVLSFLRPGLEFHFTWDAAARQRAVQLVNLAMPKL